MTNYNNLPLIGYFVGLAFEYAGAKWCGTLPSSYIQPGQGNVTAQQALINYTGPSLYAPAANQAAEAIALGIQGSYVTKTQITPTETATVRFNVVKPTMVGTLTGIANVQGVGENVVVAPLGTNTAPATRIPGALIVR